MRSNDVVGGNACEFAGRPSRPPGRGQAFFLAAGRCISAPRSVGGLELVERFQHVSRAGESQQEGKDGG